MGSSHSHSNGNVGSCNGNSEIQPSPPEQPPEKPPTTTMVPVEKLAKLLAQYSHKEEGVNGITETTFTRCVFPAYPELGQRVFQHFVRAARPKHAYLNSGAFRTQCERLMGMLDDDHITDVYVRMWASADISEENPAERAVRRMDLRGLLFTSYRLAMDHHPDKPLPCPMVLSLDQYQQILENLPAQNPGVERTLQAVVAGCFGTAEQHSVGFVARWLHDNCLRLVLAVHRYCVHALATRHRQLAEGPQYLELGTPVLERGLETGEEAERLLPPSLAWLLAAAAPPLYSQPAKPPKPSTTGNVHGGVLPSAAFVARIVAVPGHWVPLYSSRLHGRAANRFLHHSLAYRGPNAAVFSCDGGRIRLALLVPEEWRESHRYWGSADTVLFQLYPNLVFRGERGVYLNLSVRGYPKGLRAGPDPREPLLSLDEDFDKLEFRGAPYRLDDIEVWGCGEPGAREKQLDVKRWQVQEAERQRSVKLSAADWLDHPDRYLLTLAGREQYTDTAQ